MLTDAALKQKHLAQLKIDKTAPYGILIYTYNEGVFEKSYYNPDSMNIGDYVQTLAARQFLPAVSAVVDRDNLSLYQGPKINMIMNAWYRIWEKNKVLPETINPLCVSIHLNNTTDISDETIACFKKHEPIGCRDYATRDFLQSHGVEAYFSGCLTLTLGNTYRAPESERTDNIYFVDYKMGYQKNQIIDNAIQNVLDDYAGCPISYLTHAYPKNKNYNESLKEAESLIKRYARARLVITKNIHCALPCLALNTPVILIVPAYDAKRFKGLFDFFNVIGYGPNGAYTVYLNKTANGNIINKQEHLPYADYLTQICKAFAQTTQTKPMPDDIEFFNHQTPYPTKKAKRRLIFDKERRGNKRIITLFRCVRITYKRRKK